MKLYIKKFNELSINDLYAILKARVDVFVVEQNCPYEEIDNMDQRAIHIYYKEGDKILAYLRVLHKSETSKSISIGRVVSLKRRSGLASKLIQEGIKVAQEYFNAQVIDLEAQTYAKTLYEKQGFKQISSEFLVDGIPHIKMELKIDKM